MEDIMHREFGVIVTSIVFTLLTASSYAAPTQTVMVPMRDGVKLATDVYLPAGEGTWPAIVARTPYGKGDLSLLAIPLAAGSTPKEWITRFSSTVDGVNTRMDTILLSGSLRRTGATGKSAESA